MKPMYLPDVETNPKSASGVGAQIEALQEAGIEVPQILHIFAYKPNLAEELGRFSEVVMRGPSPLDPGMRELIAAFTSARNHCVF